MRKIRIIIENKKITIMNYKEIKKIENKIIIVDDLTLIGDKLEINEIVEGSIKIYGDISKIEF